MVAFALSPVPSTFITSPNPKRSCSIICPARTPVTDAAFEAADCALLFPLTALTFFRFLGTLGAIICAFGRARCSEELLPKEARDGEAERVEQIYTRDTIDDGILEGQMERSNAREPVTKAVLRLLRKKRLGLPNSIFP